MRCGASACERAHRRGLAEYDAVAGRARYGGPSATPSDFSPPGGAYIVGFVDGMPACGGIKALGDGNAELKYLAAGYREVAYYNDNPHADFWGDKRL